ncbi:MULTISPECIES: hypothetical protein [unclassified Sphingobium]|uniref:hypothetical protein n=1 Tax=unclassified Sphingobium TaxID=2611147 RepID=UPI0010F9E187|nr:MULTISPECIES: hypothetical protein [unclassified Sphingobium]MCB4858403.1 hypothetical protein [Sphingobium sp. PNB]UXC89516.1 hypothetical protein EGM87_10540 [Sphingobium sp. RSMS]
MRALIIAPSLIATPVASAATGLVCTPTTTQDPAWLGLLDDEREASSAYNMALEAEDQAYDRYFAASKAAEAKWQAAWDEKAGKPHEFIDARPAHETGDLRVTNGIADHNAFCARMRAERDTLEESCDRESGLPAAKEECRAAGQRQGAAIRAIVAYPSRDPDIIAHKLRLLIGEYGDDEGDLTPLLTSIVGEA